jgi:hypothetical protein
MQNVPDTSAKIALERASITLRLLELEYLKQNFPVMAKKAGAIQAVLIRRLRVRAECRWCNGLRAS